MGRGTTRALLAAVVAMGILIVAGVAVLGVVAARRLSAPGPAASLTIDEPTGTTIASASLSGERLAVLLHGGGPDRVVVLDLRGGVLARAALAR